MSNGSKSFKFVPSCIQTNKSPKNFTGGLFGKVPHERGAFFRIEVYKTVGISHGGERKGEERQP